MDSLFDESGKASVPDVVIVGAGASGLACAIQCAKSLKESGRKGARVVVLESSSKPGRSILASGNGRCNFSNAKLAGNAGRSMYQNSAFVSQAAEALRDSAEVGTLSWLRKLGLVWGLPTDDGLLYPYSNKAATVLGVLLSACRRLGVEVLTDVRIDKVRAQEGQGSGFVLEGERGIEVSRDVTAKGRVKRKLSWVPCSVKACRVVVAVGGAPSQGLVEGHELVADRPVLAPIKALGVCSFDSLDGVRTKARLTVSRGDDVVFSEVGEILFRPYGISGIVTFNASRHYSQGSMLYLDFAPDYSEKDLFDLFRFITSSLGSSSVADVLSGMLAPELVDYFVRALEETLASYARSCAEDEQEGLVSFEGKLRIVAAIMKRSPLVTVGVSDAVAPQVHRGGVDVFQVDPATLESLRTRGLYVLGEALDVDGPCGGYNLDWAWTCGILAGTHIAGSLSLDN